ncbi:MAG: glutamine synthetase [Rhodospirillaceae bacterium]|jgi:glutamine synthetase|nr:glutamine synthetase [Rhodospirillaceae bacterium]MBT5896692.1 glutamine synthetase [Rhodospirillaceae bacterium]MBT6428472.1 glutamine synthetase [Rhodospirillaceae bacterium]MBT7756642.1 glutamine synthetase [Rhodospirillaceae bacterium]
MAKTAAGARGVKTAAQARQIVKQRGLDYIKVGVFDGDGVLRGKYMGAEKFLAALDKGFGFCDVVLGWDSNDQLYDNTAFTGWHTGYPDAQVRLLPDSCRDLPHEFDGRGLLFLGEFEGEAEEICPRGLLRRVLARATDMGLTATAALEYEFFLFDETPESAAAKGYRDLNPITPGNFGYSVLRGSTWADFHGALLKTCTDMDFPLEGLHTETGPGVLEASIDKDEALAAADKAALFKTFAKVEAQRHGLMATFMAKWSPDYPGQSGHIHLSLNKTKGGQSAFFDAKADGGVSPAMRHFIGGQQTLMPELLAMIAPTVNAYTRLIPGFWAPTDATWGFDNRTCALRVIGGGAKSQRVEYRVAAADANPYLALAAAIGSGLWGMEHGIEPTAPIAGNAYDRAQPKRLSLPQSLGEAAQRLERSKAARALFGDAFVAHFAATREWEERQSRRAVTDWQLQRYFEII